MFWSGTKEMKKDYKPSNKQEGEIKAKRQICKKLFYFLILVCAIVATTCYVFSQFIAWKAHNLYVHNSMIGCTNDLYELKVPKEKRESVCIGDKRNAYIFPEFMNMPYREAK